MKIMQVDVKVGRAEAESAEVLVLTHCEGGALEQAGRGCDRQGVGRFAAGTVAVERVRRQGQRNLVYHTQGKVPAKRLLLVGLGKKNDVTLDAIRQALGHAVKRVRQAKSGFFHGLDLPPSCPKDIP